MSSPSVTSSQTRLKTTGRKYRHSIEDIRLDRNCIESAIIAKGATDNKDFFLIVSSEELGASRPQRNNPFGTHLKTSKFGKRPCGDLKMNSLTPGIH